MKTFAVSGAIDEPISIAGQGMAMVSNKVLITLVICLSALVAGVSLWRSHLGQQTSAAIIGGAVVLIIVGASLTRLLQRKLP